MKRKQTNLETNHHQRMDQGKLQIKHLTLETTKLEVKSG
jgi:hypothetical protein